MRSDVEFLGLVPAEAPGRFTFIADERLTRHDRRLYGGAAIAASIVAAEVTSERPALWMTTQFVASAPRGATMVVVAEALASGRRTSQFRVTGTDADGSVMFASLGATGHPRPDGISGEFENGPTVSPPDASEPIPHPFAALIRAAGLPYDEVPEPPPAGFMTAIELRTAEVTAHPDPGPGRICMWARRRDATAVTPATAGFLADVVPMSIAHAIGAIVGGTSLDNTLRIGSFVGTEWVLLDLRAHLAVGGYGHGIVHVWSEDAHLLATASQTTSMFRIDPASLPWVKDG